MDNSLQAVESITKLMADYANEVLQGKETVYQARGIERQAMDSLYGVARSFYQNGKYEDAVRIFRQLCFYDHNNAHYWIGLGYGLKMLKEYKEAMTVLSFVLSYLDSGDKTAEVYLQLAECCGLLGRDEEAKEYVIEAIKGGNQSIKDKASVLRNALDAR